MPVGGKRQTGGPALASLSPACAVGLAWTSVSGDKELNELLFPLGESNVFDWSKSCYGTAHAVSEHSHWEKKKGI